MPLKLLDSYNTVNQQVSCTLVSATVTRHIHATAAGTSHADQSSSNPKRTFAATRQHS